MPRVLGHEIAALVHAQNGVSDYAPGEMVVVHPGVSCGVCEYCLSGRDNRCDGIGIIGFSLDGGFSEYTRIPAKGVSGGVLLKAPAGIAAKHAALSEPLACAIRQRQVMQMGPQGKLLILGAGALGILTAKLWTLEGWRVFLLDIDPAKIETAKRIGFEASDSVTGAFDAAVVCAPDPGAYEIAVERLKKGGTLGYFSGISGEVGMSRSALNLIHYKELQVSGAYGCALEDTKAALKLLQGPLTIEDELIVPIGFEELEDHLKTETKNIFTQLILMEVQ
jgi:L-iditol 2-dehydrogenase